MLRDEKQVALDQLNKDLNDLLTLYNWLEDNADADVLVRRYENVSERARETSTIVRGEIRDAGELPSDADPDRQALEQVVILLKSTLSDEQVDVMESHLQTAMDKARDALGQNALDGCQPETRIQLAALRLEMEKVALN